ncbi:hypothetical protein EVG20_g5987 [Dentipellis fragilis]|uniref:Glycosyl transferase family 1 domain-containing protein n=1 Tax=Dentipellis fragilis TaxID=205917 RepID=A0A4Y9YQ79_9AGAM|nr:hypothetical protein EVG20_g5987 [Dentipellis fragilis]
MDAGDALSIAMICDFFHPNVGGVENHIYMLSANLIKRGHKSPPGSRWNTLALTVPESILHPLPDPGVVRHATQFPHISTIPAHDRPARTYQPDTLTRKPFVPGTRGDLARAPTGCREYLDQQAAGSDDEKRGRSYLRVPYRVWCLTLEPEVVSFHVDRRENTVLRSKLPPDHVYVIPNAIVADQFKPAEVPPPVDTITIVVVSRLAYRKGIDLLVATAPRICAAFPNVQFVVGGDGPKLIDLLQMREKHFLQDRIEVLGPIRHRDVRNVLVQGSIFLNTSLTESFGIAILEAACAGLYVVSTRVGGVPEILPEDMISFANPTEEDVFRALSEAIEIVRQGKHDPHRAHERIKGFYDWAQVAERTEVVYRNVMAMQQQDLWTRIERTMGLGLFSGPIFTIILIVDCLFFMFLEWWMPREGIDYVDRHWDERRFREVTQ